MCKSVCVCKYSSITRAVRVCCICRGLRLHVFFLRRVVSHMHRHFWLHLLCVFHLRRSELLFTVLLPGALTIFPRASERRVLPIVGVCISSSHLHIFSSSHLLLFTSSHLHTFSSSHLLTSHLLIFTSSHLHIFSLHIFSSSHLLIFTSSHLHIFSSSHLLIFTSSHLHSCSSSHLHICSSSHLLRLPQLPSCPLLLFYFSSEGGGRGSANETARNATLSHETRFHRQKLR